MDLELKLNIAILERSKIVGNNLVASKNMNFSLRPSDILPNNRFRRSPHYSLTSCKSCPVLRAGGSPDISQWCSELQASETTGFHHEIDRAPEGAQEPSSVLAPPPGRWSGASQSSGSAALHHWLISSEPPARNRPIPIMNRYLEEFTRPRYSGC